MAKLTISQPKNWVFDKSKDIKRDWMPDVDSSEKIRVAEANKDKYDFETIFYSVGYCRSRSLFYAVGPKLLNFEALVLPIKARFSTDYGKSFTDLDSRILHHSISFNLTIINFPADEIPDCSVLLELELACGDTKTFSIDNQEKKPVSVIQNAHQKDNEVDWIVDWLNYYQSMGVSDFHIYDNGSDNFDNVCEAIGTLVPDHVNVEITIWPYRFGMSQFFSSQFSQNASIIDFNYQSQHADWAMNFDIDEYLLIDERFFIVSDLLQSVDSKTGNIRFGCSDAPLIKGQVYPENVSVRDLNWRTKEIRTKFKNAFIPAHTETASIHNVKLKKGYKPISPNEETCFYLHARPLNTGWCAPARKKALHVLSSGDFVEDRRVANRMKLIDASSAVWFD